MYTGKILFGVHEGSFILKLVDDLRLNNSLTLYHFDFNSFTHEPIKHGYIDFSAATGIDSTTFGLLAQFSQELMDLTHEKPIAIGANENIYRLLISMRFEKIMNFLKVCELDESNCIELSQGTLDEVDIGKRSLEAHRALCELSVANKIRFQEVVDALEQDLIKRGNSK